MKKLNQIKKQTRKVIYCFLVILFLFFSNASSRIKSNINFIKDTLSQDELANAKLVVKLTNLTTKNIFVYKKIYIGYKNDAFTDMFLLFYKKNNSGQFIPNKVDRVHFQYFPNMDDNSKFIIKYRKSYNWSLDLNELYPLKDTGCFYVRAYFTNRYYGVDSSNLEKIYIKK